MSVASVRTISLQGTVGHVVDVQADVRQGMVKTSLVGRPDAAINEARDRCRAAVVNSRFEWPNTRRVTILLSPADLPKRGPHFDLAIAVAVLAASADPPWDPDSLARLDDVVLAGELTLDGRLRCVPGVLPMVMAAAQRGIARVVVPEPQVQEAALVPGIEVVGARSLAQVVAQLTGQEVPEARPVAPPSGQRVLTWRGEERLDDLDLADVVGVADARYALEVAAAGSHHLLLTGPKGAGKTTLAERLPGLLPDLDVELALEVSAIYSLTGSLRPGEGLSTRPPFRAPHTSASRASLLGGGTGKVHPGEVSRAHGGVLFLDEFPHFSADIIESLRQPLESGDITLARGEETATYPARCLVVLACNPCPCGEYSPARIDHRCTCPEVKRREYRRKISGPIADRIDITRHVEPVGAHEAFDPVVRPEPTSVVKERVGEARSRQAARLGGTPWRLNGDVPGPVLREQWGLRGEAGLVLDEALRSGRLSRRGATRVHRVAWTVADLRGAGAPSADDVRVAVALRLGEPLPLTALVGAR